MRRIYLYPGLVILLILMAGQVQSQIPNIQISFPTPELQNEEQVMYCPTDENIIISTWRDFRLGGVRHCAIGRSTDGGATWTDAMNLLTVSPFQSDPCMTVDRTGNFYCCYMDFDVYNTNSNLIIVKSTNYGTSWDGPYTVLSQPSSEAEDKEFIACDRTGGTYDGNIYLAWTRVFMSEDHITIDSSAIVFSRSTDGGINFSEPVTIRPYREVPACGYGYTSDLFVQPIVGSDGAVYAFFVGYATIQDQCDSLGCMFMSKSTDGGETWPIINQSIFCFDGPTHWQADGGIDVYGSPTADADITGGLYDGSIYVTFLDWINDGDLYHADIRMIKSTDNGVSWLDPVRINDDPLGVDVDQFHPWMIVNEDGVIVVVFYDQRLDVNHYMFDVFAAYSYDGGETFTPNHRITDVSSSPDDLGKAGSLAEYIGVAAHHDNITAVWTDLRNGNQDVFAASYVKPNLPPRLYEVANSSYLTVEPDSLVWGSCWFTNDISYRLELSAVPDFASLIVDNNQTANKYYNSGLGLEDGLYYWRVKGFRVTADDSTEYSDVWSFYIDREAPNLATLVSPSEGSTTRDYSPEFSWSVAPGTIVAPEYYEIEVSDNDQFTGSYYYHGGDLTGTTHNLPEDLPGEGSYFWRVNHYDLSGNESGYTAVNSFNVVDFLCGDANSDMSVNIGDVVYIGNYVFRNGECVTSPPIGCPPDPYEAGDSNCDGSVNIGDAVYLGNVIFRPGSPGPCASCP